MKAEGDHNTHHGIEPFPKLEIRLRIKWTITYQSKKSGKHCGRANENKKYNITNMLLP
jgi:hypothetical protein